GFETRSRPLADGPLSMTPRHLIGIGTVTALASLASPTQAAWQSGGIPVCTGPMEQRPSAVVSDGSGGAVVVWKDQASHQPYAQRIDAGGNAVWPLNGVPVSTIADVFARDLVAASDGAGGVFVAWADRRNRPQLDVFAQHLDAQGVAQWGPN